MRIIIRKFILLILTFVIITFSCVILFKLYKSACAIDKSNWTCYCDKEFNFNIIHQKSYPIAKNSLFNNYIIKQFIIPIASPGILNSKYTCCYINILKKDNFKSYLKINKFTVLKRSKNLYGENYFYAASSLSYNSYFFQYNDYIFELKEPVIGFAFEDSKIHEMTKNILMQSFKRN
ncbi:hypothetical protein CLTEP_18010 [Clostridium tepidiprofundi DSM 19306]|uniref:Uncharacterized protein n=1 Tax=Clostridium tepidiprofundi DSM 19306 TaxID=1121338 RepID=A0A151B2V5_9CLOT|nr:hypothetical protein [Clostridium tepidiprofundi]KYH34226.1 hypothetical protein CLTEP_18010 [Clostridium tepidiprofundi DSM 19306]